MSAGTARRVLKIEAQGLLSLSRRIGPSFDRAVNLILKSKGRVAVTGMGKSGLVGQKIAATLSATGTPSFPLNPAEALHGDLGKVTHGDVALFLSNSGETEELKTLLPHLKKRGCRTVLLTGNPHSTLARQADIVVDVGVPQEACPFNLSPTASTTAALAVGDALAIALLEKRGFTEKDFAIFHPGGELGRRLQLKVKDIMRQGSQVPKVAMTAGLSRIIQEINSKKVGATCVVDGKKRLRGIIVDGDIRRAILKNPDTRGWSARSLCTPRPSTISPEASLAQALQLMEEKAIFQLLIVDGKKRLTGLLHLHDLLGRGRVRVL